MATITRYITADTFINSYVDYASDNYGSSSWSIELYNGGVNDSLYALLDIDLSAIIGKTVTAATLNLYLDSFSGSPTFVFKRITSSWAESTVTYDTKPTVDTTVYGSTSPATTAGWKTFDLTSLVQNIAGGSTYNGIWMYSSVNEDYAWGYFDSREDANPGYITITYNDVAATATSTGLALTPTYKKTAVPPLATSTSLALPATAKANKAGVTATGTSLVLPPTVKATKTAEIATSTSLALPATARASITAETATSTSLALPTVAGFIATSTSQALAPTVRASNTSEVATSTSEALAPTVKASKTVEIATSTSTALAPTVKASKTVAKLVMLNPSNQTNTLDVNGVPESTNTRELSVLVEDYLDTNGASVAITQYDPLDDLAAIVALEHILKPSIFVAIHFNGFDGSVRGTEIIYYSSDTYGQGVATAVVDSVSTVLSTTNRGVKTSASFGGVYVIDNTNCSAILIEVCFMDNVADMTAYVANKAEVATAIATNILSRLASTIATSASTTLAPTARASKTAEVATSTSLALAPTIKASKTAEIATSTSTALAPTVKATKTAEIATSTSEALTPVPQIPVATSTSLALPATTEAKITAAVALCAGDASPPTATANKTGATASSTSLALPATTEAKITAVTAASTNLALAPAGKATKTGATAISTSRALPPVEASREIPLIELACTALAPTAYAHGTPSIATSTGLALAPSIVPIVTRVSNVATATVRCLVPNMSGGAYYSLGKRFWFVDNDGDGVCETEVKILRGSWSIEERMNARSTLSATIQDANGATISYGKQIQLYHITTSGMVLLFGGVIVSRTVKEVQKGSLWYSIKVDDYCALTDRPVIMTKYENMTIGAVVNALITDYFSASGITAGTIEAETTINIMKLNYMKGNEALDHLAGFGNFVWTVDKDKKLHFYDLGGAYRPVSTVQLTNESGFELNSDGGNYFNSLFVKGNKKQTEYQVQKKPTPAPDGVTREFFTKYPIAKEPFVEINTGGGWGVATIGVKGLATGKQFYWSYGDTQLSQADTETVLAVGSEIRVSYYGLIQIFIVTNNYAEQTSKGFVVQEYRENAKLYHSNDAANYARQLLDKYSNECDKISFELIQKDYEVGETFRLVKAAPWNINEDFLIEACSWKPMGVNRIRYSYKILDGSSLGGWEDFFKNLFAPAHIEVSDNEIVITLKQLNTEFVEVTGEYNITLDTPLAPSETLAPSTTLAPGIFKSSDLVIDGTPDSTVLYVPQDAYLYSNIPNNNYNTDILEIYNGGVGDSLIPLLYFDMATLAGKRVVDATLSMYAESMGDSITVGIKLVTSAWSESTVTYTTAPTTGTTVYATQAVSTGAGWKTFDVRQLVQDVIDGATYTGMWIYSTTTDYKWGKFTSSEGVSNPPRMNISYTV